MRSPALAAVAAAVALWPTVVSAQVATLRGFRIEGDAGWDQFRTSIGNNGKFAYGGQAGFDGQIGRIVIGPEVDYWHPNDDRNVVGYVTPDGGRRFRSSGDQWGAAVRVGYLATPDLLLFGKGGYVDDEQHRVAIRSTGQLARSDRFHTDGYQVGGGAEYALHNRFAFAPAGLYLSAQYVYDRFDDRTSDQHAMGGIGLRFR